MVDPYAIVALSNTVHTIKKRSDAIENTKRICDFMDPAVMVASTDGAPVKLVVLPEMAIQGMLPHFLAGDKDAHEEFAMEIPGPETEILGQKAKELNTYIAGELYLVRDPDFPGHSFNVAFLISPQGEVIYKRAKATSDAYEGGALGTTNPHDIWDEWIEKKGNGNVLDAIFPVAKTEIGNIGYVICHEGAYPEITRGLAMNGAEIIIRGTLIEPQVGAGMWELQNRAHAMFNQVYVVAPNLGPQRNDDGTLFDLFGGQSMIVDNKGRVVVKQSGSGAGDSFVSSVIDIEALRRSRTSNGVTSWFKDLRTEQYRAIYDQPIYEANQYLDAPPTTGWLAREAKRRGSNIEKLIQRGVLTPPSK
ncbi:hydrolase [Leifsonia sp. Root227]|uniref:nitrilase-related carbon-nitrogen hydrolase n=1 Tax=unclassified Leifsonia TaxID=2663824 RepID=UPI0006FFDE04|nr:nitrilase-related carbon-nitrogen hydrolase [Leifsonia sp. Root227]KRC47103.1 hydrolase [Leifsonia sp. Root227]